MKSGLAAKLSEVTRLTRTRKLFEATRLIQQILSGDENAASATRQVSHVGAEPPGTIDRAVGASNGPFFRTPQNGRVKRPLGETINLLRQGALPELNPLTRPGGTSRKRPSVQQGAEFLARSFTNAAGTRAYKLYVPRHRGPPAGLVVMLHGCTQDPDDFAIGTGMNEVAEEHGLLVAYPAQSRSANPSLCWNWFDRKDQKRGSGEPGIIAGLTEQLVAEFSIGCGRVFIAGLSAGGAMAAIMGAAYPDIYAAVGIHSGLESGAAGDLISALAAMRGDERRQASLHRSLVRGPGRVIVFHGDADQTVHSSNGDSIVAAAKAGQESGQEEVLSARSPGGIDYVQAITRNADGLAVVEHWILYGVGHAWSGGCSDGSYTDPRGPDASREMVRFFLEQTCSD